MEFAPIHVISGYSLLQSGLNFDRLFNALKKNNYHGAGLCDIRTLSGAPQFFKFSYTNDIKPLIGIELPLLFQEHIIKTNIYAIDEKGYLSLVKLSSQNNKESFDVKIMGDLLKNCIGIYSMKSPEFSFMSENTHNLYNFSNLFKKIYIGMEIYDSSDIGKAQAVRDFAFKYNYETIAFPEIRYIKPDDAITLEIVKAISEERIIETKSLKGKLYFPNEQELIRNYTDQELKATMELVNSSDFEINKKRGQLLRYSDADSFELLKQKCHDTLTQKKLILEAYRNRCDYELNIINKMGYCDYFLIVADYVHFAKTHNILVGPGRGSAAGSLVAYLLDITTADPLKYDLLFERFLNPDRVTMPDIDIDFEDIFRDRIVSYLKEKYGMNRVANIITFQTIGAKQSIRDVGRVYQYPSKDIDLLSKTIPDNKIDLHSAYKKVPAFKSLVDSDKYFLEIITLASKIEGLPRQSSLHAAGILLNNECINDQLPTIEQSDNMLISQYEMGFLEEQGFLKMDLLGLRNLTIIDKCLRLIKQNHQVDINYYDLPFDEECAYKLISSSKTMGIFQLESSGIKHAIELLKPSCFDDVVALLALFRPGPMNNIPLYARRKQGKEKVTYKVPALEPILKSTYGIMVYQEQVMQIVTSIAGFTLAQADMFRRIISKKDTSKMAKVKQDFINGALKKGYSANIANEIYADLARFGDYGFNKSHSLAYAIITCQMAYLKATYPNEFYISLLEVGSASNDVKFNEYISEMKQIGTKLVLPNINISGYEYQVYDDGLIIPLTAIRGLTGTIAQIIIEEREKNGPYNDLFNFALRVVPFGINNVQIMRLIDAGCFDSIIDSRATLRANVDSAIKYAMVCVGDSSQMSLLSDCSIAKPRIIMMEDVPVDNLQLEFEALGITVSKTMLFYKQDILKEKHITNIQNAVSSRFPVDFAAIVKSKKIIKTKKGAPMCFIKVFDDDGELEVTLFPETYANSLMYLENNNIIVLKGYYQKDKQAFIANSVHLLEE